MRIFNQALIAALLLVTKPLQANQHDYPYLLSPIVAEENMGSQGIIYIIDRVFYS